MQRILGVDPGSRITGYGLLDYQDGRLSYVTSGCVHLQEDNFPERLGHIFCSLSAIIQQYRPTEFSIEEVFVAKNAASALKLGQARGAAICAAVQQNLPVSEYSPRAIKQAVVGRGGAVKDQIQFMVRLMLGIKTSLAADAADALAVAITHAHTQSTLGQLASRGIKQ